MPFEDLSLEEPSFADVEAGSSTQPLRGEQEGERVLSPFEDLMVGEVAPPSDSTSLDTTKVHPVPEVFKQARAFRAGPTFRGFTNMIEDGKWALGLAGQALGVSADVLKAFTAGEHESNPEQFQARINRGKTVFDMMDIHNELNVLEGFQGDPVVKARLAEHLRNKFADLNDATDLMLEPKLREKLAEMQYGLEKAPPFMTIAEMFYGNARPAFQVISAFKMAAATNPITMQLAALPLEEITFDLAKQLRKEPSEVTAGEVAVEIFDQAQRGWVKFTEPLASKLPEKTQAHLVKVPLLSKTVLVPGGPTRGFIQEDIPAFAHAAAMLPGEVYYDPLFIAGETGVVARGANAGIKGYALYDEAVGKAMKPGMEKLGKAFAKKPAVYEPAVEAATKVAVATDVGAPEVFTWTPHLDPKAASERAIRGAPPGGAISSSLSSAATIASDGVQTAAERALPTIREALMDVDGRVGGVVEDMGLAGTPEEMGRQLAERSLPKGASPKLKAFNPEGPVVRKTPPKTEPTQQLGMFGAGPTGTGGGFSLGGGDLRTPVRDINFFEQLAPPRYVLYDDPNDVLAREIYKKERRSFYDGEQMSDRHAEMFSGVQELLGKASPKEQTALSKRMLSAINASDNAEAKELAKLSGKEREVATQLRENFKQWMAAKGVKRTPGMPLLETMGRHLWGEEEFLMLEKNGVLQRGAFPPELTDVPVMDNIVMKHLYPEMIPSDNVAEALRAISRGMIREDVFKPAWKEMAEAAKNLPPRKRNYVDMWIKDRQGVPSKFHENFDQMVNATKTRGQTPLAVSASNELTSAVLSAYYRGSLFGNNSTFFANFFGQGMANQLATKGAFRTFEGLARHWKHAFDGVPKGVMTGSFEALFGKEVPKSTFGLKLRSRPGIKQFRAFWEATDGQLGMGASEGINRSWAMHVGLGEAIDKYNIKNGTNLTWEQVLRKEGISDAARDDMMFEAMMHSDQVNHVWGGAGANPYIRRYLPRSGMALNNMFMNWFPKQAEFLLGPLFRRGDAGILTNYILYTGWLSNLATKSWGIDFKSSSIWGSVPSAQGSGAPYPAGPPVDALWSLFAAIHEEVADDGDPNQAKRHWEEVARHLEVLTVPGVPAREKLEIYLRSLEDGGLYTPTHPVARLMGIERPRELMGFTGPTAAEQQYPFGPAGGFDKNPENLERNIANILNSEHPARALGLPTESDRYRRRIDTEIRRMNRVWQSLMSDLTNEMLIEVQRQRGVPLQKAMKSPRMKQLMEAAESQGLPVKAMFEDRVLDQALPRITRIFQDSKKLTKQQTFEYLRDAYPDYFENPTMVWDKAHPKSVPPKDAFEDLSQ